MELTAHVMLRNEEYWVGYVLESVLKVMDEVIIIDTGSTDNTIEVCRKAVKESDGRCRVQWLLYGPLTPEQNGQARQWMTDKTHTEWAMIIDGDEYYAPEVLQTIKDTPLPSTARLGFTTLQVLQHKDGKFWLAERWSKQALFHVPSTTWSGKYPFEGPTNYDKPETFYYYENVIGYDFHHLRRSSRDAETPHRHDNIRLEQPIAGVCTLPFELGKYTNPYI
jgi:glycosyltransferase involved in cell wall biosynthesis